MEECSKCKSTIRGESGIRCASVCKKTYHIATKCRGLDSYSCGVLNNAKMLRFICDDCVLYMHNMDELLTKIQHSVEENKSYLGQYKHTLEDALASNRNEIKLLLEAVESKYGERLHSLKMIQESCKRTIGDMNDVGEVAETFSRVVAV